MLCCLVRRDKSAYLCSQGGFHSQTELRCHRLTLVSPNSHHTLSGVAVRGGQCGERKETGCVGCVGWEEEEE